MSLAGLAVKAQEPSFSGQLSWQIIAGYSQSAFRGKDISFVFENGKAAPASNYFMGLQLNQPLTEKWGLQYAVNFQRRGARLTLENTKLQLTETQLHSYYITLMPIALTYRYHRVRLAAGPYFSSLLQATLINGESTVFGRHGLYGKPNNSEDKHLYLQKIDWGWQSTLELSLSRHFALQATYMLGLNDSFQNANAYDHKSIKTKIDVYQNDWMLGLSYKF